MMRRVPEAMVGIGTNFQSADFTRVEKIGSSSESAGPDPDLECRPAGCALPFARDRQRGPSDDGAGARR